MNFNIAYEDNEFLIIHKPAGVPVQVDARSVESTVLTEVQKTYPEAELAHRLDKDTSGLLVIAKNHTAYEYLKFLFKKRRVTKTYIALVSGVVSKDKGVICLAIVRSKKDFRKRIATPRVVEGARSAETHFKVTRRFKEYTLLEVSPKTGRTHQVRSHLASIGHPIACDGLYGGRRYLCPPGLRRQFLHAAGLEFATKDNKRIHLEAKLPSDLERALESLSRAESKG